MRRIYYKGDSAPAIRLLRAFKWCRERPWVGYPASVALGAFLLALQFFARDQFEGAPFLTLYPAVVAATFIAGWPGGVICATIQGAAQWVYFIPTAGITAIVTYAFDAIICVFTIDFLTRSFDLLIELIEQEKQSGRRHYLISRELSHRIQNLFQVIQAVIRLSLPGSPAIRDRLLDRFQAMSMTNMLISESEQNGVALAHLVDTEAKPFKGRVHATLTAGLMLSPQLAQNLSLILHELGTNALKYGALSVNEGSVVLDVDWNGRYLWLRWHEHDGPLVKKPQEIDEGFGTRLLDNFAKRLGSVRTTYDPRGLVYSLKIEADHDIWIGTTVIREAS